MLLDLNGTWKGYICSTWIHQETGNRLDPIPVILTIHQSENSLSCTMRTKEMTSYSHSENLKLDNKTQGITLAYQYGSTPQPFVKERSEMHNGTMAFTVVNGSVRKLVGNYYTDRKTTGEVEVEFWMGGKLSHFPDHFEEHPAILNDGQKKGHGKTSLDNQELMEEIEGMISSGEIPEAIEELLKVCKSKGLKGSLKELRTIQSSFNHLESNRRAGIINDNDHALARRKAVNQILEVLENICSQTN